MKKSIISFCLFFLLLMQITDAQVPVLYGLTSTGGKYENGSIIKLNGNGTGFDTVYSFNTLGGYQPSGSLIASNGLLYGMTQLGGYQDFGVIFSFNPSDNSYTDLYDLNDTDGAYPQGNLILVNDSIFYGVTSAGGLPNYQGGVIFSFNPRTKTYKNLYTFINPNGIVDTNGINPTGSLLEDGNNLYGITSAGGDYTYGVIFSYNLSNSTYSKLFDLDGAQGGVSYGSLVKASNGVLYGLTSSGGIINKNTAGYGTLFSFNTSGNSYSDLYTFNNTLGAYPHGSLILATNGNLYGMAELGGNINNNGIGYGTIFSFNPDSNTFHNLYEFNGVTGSQPHGSLVQGTDGNLYGMTAFGGNDSVGNIFSYNISDNSFTNLISLNDTLCSAPYGDLIETSTVSGINQLPAINYQLSIYPNPSSGIITITSSKNIDKLTITNLLGQLIYASQPKQTLCNIVINNDGMYFVTVTSDNEAITKNVIITK